MIPVDVRNDPVLAALSDLPIPDVDDLRAHRLRRRCRAALMPATRPAKRSRGLSALPWRRVLGPAVAALWGALYVVETLRQAAAIYTP